MATFRGFLRSIETRSNGWIEATLVAVHAGNAARTFFIPSVDGDLEKLNRRLAQLGLLRDALARSLPVELQYESEGDQGDLIADVTIYQRPSFEGRPGDRLLRGTVIGVAVSEHDASSGTSPYRDDADLANVTLLDSSGGIENLLIDLQRPDPGTAKAMLSLAQRAYDSRRPIEILVATTFGGGRDNRGDSASQAAFIRSCRLPPLPASDLDFVHAFVERLGQRSESWQATELASVNFLRVVFTTAPDQTPEGDVSGNGSFVPVTRQARVAVDSPLVARLQAALRDGLQVRLGLAAQERDPKNDRLASVELDDAEIRAPEIHAVELVCPLGSAARPIWIDTRLGPLRNEQPTTVCDGVPTLKTPDHKDFATVPCSITWTGHGWFAKGVWRLITIAEGGVDLTVDGAAPCCHCDEVPLTAKVTASQRAESASGKFLSSLDRIGERVNPRGPLHRCVHHVYLDGLHEVALVVHDRTCGSPFRLQAYRIR